MQTRKFRVYRKPFHFLMCEIWFIIFKTIQCNESLSSIVYKLSPHHKLQPQPTLKIPIRLITVSHQSSKLKHPLKVVKLWLTIRTQTNSQPSNYKVNTTWMEAKFALHYLTYLTRNKCDRFAQCHVRNLINGLFVYSI